MILILFVTTIYAFFNTVMISREVLSFQDFTNIAKLREKLPNVKARYSKVSYGYLYPEIHSYTGCIKNKLVCIVDLALYVAMQTNHYFMELIFAIRK